MLLSTLNLDPQQELIRKQRLDMTILPPAYDFREKLLPYTQIGVNHYMASLCLLLQKQLLASLFTILAYFQEADRLNLQKHTKFMAKSLLDGYLIQNQDFDVKQTELLLITVLRLACKFYENGYISDMYTIDVCIMQCQQKYSSEQFLDFELRVFQCSDYQLLIQTPYDFETELIELARMPQISQLCTRKTLKDKPCRQGSFQETVIQIVDYAITITDLASCTGEEIYLGALLALLKQRRVDDQTLALIRVRANCTKEAIKIADIILKSIQRLSKPNKKRRNRS